MIDVADMDVAGARSPNTTTARYCTRTTADGDAYWVVDESGQFRYALGAAEPRASDAPTVEFESSAVPAAAQAQPAPLSVAAEPAAVAPEPVAVPVEPAALAAEPAAVAPEPVAAPHEPAALAAEPPAIAAEPLAASVSADPAVEDGWASHDAADAIRRASEDWQAAHAAYAAREAADDVYAEELELVEGDPGARDAITGREVRYQLSLGGRLGGPRHRRHGAARTDSRRWSSGGSRPRIHRPESHSGRLFDLRAHGFVAQAPSVERGPDARTQASCGRHPSSQAIAMGETRREMRQQADKSGSQQTPAPFGISRRDLDQRTSVISVEGDLDLSTAPQLKWMLVDSLEEGHDQLVVDLSLTGFMDSTALGVLVGVNRSLPGDGRLAIVCTGASLLKIFELSGMDGAFAISASLDDALARAQRPAAEAS